MSPEKEKILLHTVTGPGIFRFGEFYNIDLVKGEISEWPFNLLADAGLNSMVSVGSAIYIVGGSRYDRMQKTAPPNSRCCNDNKKGLYHKGVSYLDLAEREVGWQESPFASKGLSPSPAMVAFQGKIYLFHRGGQSVSANVFYTISSEYSTLFPPPQVGYFDALYDTSAVADPDNNRILVHFSTINSVFAFYPETCEWDLFLESFAWPSPLVLVDGVIYYYLVYFPETPELVGAYDIATKQRLNIVFTSELSHRVWRYEFDAMIK